MPKLWFERELIPEFKALLPDDVTITGYANTIPAKPFARIADASGLVISTLDYTDDVMAQAPKLLVISRTGIGIEKIDIHAATQHGIAVCNAPDAPSISTAEFAITLMLQVAKNVKAIEREVRHELRNGTKRRFYKDYIGVELYEKQLGIVGCGRIGSQVAHMANAIGMHVVAYDPYLTDKRMAELPVRFVNLLDDLLQTSDVVSLHLPLYDATYKLMNTKRFDMMKQGAIFINTARGGHVDEAALLAAIDSGHLFGAGMDVTDPEPPQADNPLLDRDNVIITPHIASGTTVGKQRIFQLALSQALMVIRGERPPNLVNPDVWQHVMERRENLTIKTKD